MLNYTTLCFDFLCEFYIANLVFTLYLQAAKMFITFFIHSNKYNTYLIRPYNSSQQDPFSVEQVVCSKPDEDNDNYDIEIKQQKNRQIC